ncbi:type IV secretion protein Rhs [Planctomonas sp. JC2975]|uniref:DUF6531 domain-containing protein n=1 Tax=Planctomonas sp. JC2975 TaxID=2729626 RepID=UPI001472BF6A|nr:DUF6531 domain-containing protein [Planctomonas sp. JC2975]NNC11906.1 type IV secretion protein Rhs [Planctomonas sp. JC2975]
MGDLGAYKENVKFSDSDAAALVSACNSAADAIDGQKGSRSSARSTGSDQFKGYFSTLFHTNGTTQVSDATEVASALRQVAKFTTELQKSADAEQQRRVKARQWEDQQKHRNVFEKGWDDVSSLWGGDAPSVPDAEPQVHHSAPKPPAGTRETPQPGSGGGTPSGTSSAIPANLRSFATSTTSDDTTLTTQHTAVQKAYAAFAASCGWGSLDASGVVLGFQQFIDANKQEVTWANTIAGAFEKAGGSGSLRTLSNQALAAALAAAHVSASRTDLTIDMPSVLGGVPTSGYADDPVNTATGNFTEPETDLAFSEASSALAFTRDYNSAATTVGAFGPGWSSWSEARLILTEESARWVLADGRHIVFPRRDDAWDRAVGSSYWLARRGDALVVTDNAGGRWLFDEVGRLVSFDRGAGTRVEVGYDPDGRFAGLIHERGRSVSVEWSGDRIVRATASDGRQVAYRYDESGRLVEASGPAGARRYVWGDSSGLVEQVIDADGVVEVVNGYDDEGRVAWQRSPFGRVSRYSYLPGGITEVADTDGERSNAWIADPSGRLTGVIDAHGNSQSYAWDAYGGMIEATDRMGQRTVREYDERGRLIRELSPSGADVQYGYDDKDRIVTVVAGIDDGANAVTTYAYDSENRNPSVIVDPVGGRTSMVWERGLLSEVTDPTGVVLRFGYDANGELVSSTNAVGGTARLERDAAGRVSRAITPSGHRTDYGYDAAGVLVSRRDPDGALWRYEHTAAGRLSAQIAPDGGRTEFGYGPDGSESRTTDPLGRVAIRAVDDLGNLASLRLPDGSTWSYTHDALSRLVETIDPTGGAWRNRFDADGDLTATEDPTGVVRTVTADRTDNTVAVDEGLLATTIRLDSLGRAQTIATADDDVLTYVYDAGGRVVELLDAEGALTLIVRDAAGRPVKVTDPTGVTTGYAYDSCGRLSQVIAHDGAVTTREYDADSRLVRQILPGGDAAWARYDACGRLTQVHQPGSGTATYTYDKCGRVASALDTWWGTRRFGYDLAGQLIAVTNGLGAVTRFEYDANGRLTRVIDPFGAVTQHTWDAMDRLVAETDPLGRSTTAGYDPAGRQLWQQSPDGHRLAFAYDAFGAVESTSVDGEVIASNTYDTAGRAVSILDRTGAEELTHLKQWDRAGRLVRHSRISSDGTDRSLTWTYDRAGRRTSMVDAFGRTTSYHYDDAGRLERVEHPVLGSTMLRHDAAGRLVAAETSDPRGRVTRQTWAWTDGVITSHTAVTGDETSDTVIDRDADGRISSITRDGVSTRYGYDVAEQLTELVADGVSQSWSFDLGGRVASQTVGGALESYSYDPAGQLVAVHHGDGTTTRHEYDPDGARTRTVLPDGTVRSYEWTATGWLSGLTSTSTGGDGATTVFETDAIGQLTEAGSNTLWWDTAATVPTLVGVGSVPVLPLGPVTGIGDRWITAGWRTTRGDSTNPWQIASVATLPDGFGLTASGTLSLARSAGFAPLEWLGARTYDPATHGFLATDPLPPVPGAGWASNPYSYAGNNPLAFSDPTGLHPLTDDELRKQTQGWLSKAWDATTHWVGDNWEYLVAGAAIVGGIALMCTGVGGPAGIALMAASGALIAGGADTAIQKATTGKVDWGQVAVTAVVGAATGGAGAWAAGVSAAANGATALAYSVGLNGGIGALGSEATYLITNHSHLSWQGAAGAFVGGGVGGAIGGGAGPAGGTVARNILGGAEGATTSVVAKTVTAGINAAGGAAGDVTTQVVSSPGQPINWQHVAVSGGAGAATSVATGYIPGPAAVNSLEQQSYFGTRSWSGVTNMANGNTRAMVGSAAIGGLIGSAEGPGIDAVGG